MPYSLAATSSGQVFSHAHIALTAAVTGLLALAGAWWRLPHHAWNDVAAIAVLSAASVYLWRASANTPQLNGDRPARLLRQRLARPRHHLPVPGLYAQARPPADARRYGQARALATIASLAVNVITI